MERMKARLELLLQGVIDGSVPRQPAQLGQARRADTHGKMCLSPRRRPRMAMVKMRLVYYIQHVRGKSSSQRRPDAFSPACQFLWH